MGTSLAEILAAPVLDVAPRLLGGTLSHGGVTALITEVEAYDGANDPGSHAANGPTPRNRVMFGPPAYLYVYLIYGMHHCANVVCGPAGTAAAVLLRAGRIEGAEPRTAQGPGRLCRALGIDRGLSGVDLATGPVRLELGEALPATSIATGPRVGLRRAAEHPWRFWIAEDPSVSRYVPAKPLRGS